VPVPGNREPSGTSLFFRDYLKGRGGGKNSLKKKKKVKEWKDSFRYTLSQARAAYPSILSVEAFTSTYLVLRSDHDARKACEMSDDLAVRWGCVDDNFRLTIYPTSLTTFV
jgi:hypothetical protein